MDKRLLQAVVGLKDIKRKGWAESGVKAPESVADHTCGVALCVLFASLTREDIDRSKALTMALIHDLAEVVVGDITPADKVRKEDKLAREEKALKALFSSLHEYDMYALIAIWKELQEGETEEAKLVLNADVFERTLQAKVYKDRGEKVERFFDAVKLLKGSDFERPLKLFMR
jgi:putative hydrolase of HD superfamily